MRIATYNLEPKIVNTALMQVWRWAKDNGHEVEHYNHLLRREYDRIYAFSLFDFTPKHYVTPEMICGGTGFDVGSYLPAEITECDYDYSAYPPDDPVWDGEPYSIVWFSRGCIRRCPFCVVREKEGTIYPVTPKPLNPDGRYVVVQDNNFFANTYWRQAIRKLKEWGQPVALQGVDLRLLDDEQVDALKTLRHRKRLKVAWDDPRIDMMPKLKWLAERSSPVRVMVYILIGYKFPGWRVSSHEENLRRVNEVAALGMSPFVMPYDKSDGYQRHFARWVNGFVYKVASWEEYQTGEKVTA